VFAMAASGWIIAGGVTWMLALVFVLALGRAGLRDKGDPWPPANVQPQAERGELTRE
jgi:hypothetical protein